MGDDVMRPLEATEALEGYLEFRSAPPDASTRKLQSREIRAVFSGAEQRCVPVPRSLLNDIVNTLGCLIGELGCTIWGQHATTEQRWRLSLARDYALALQRVIDANK